MLLKYRKLNNDDLYTWEKVAQPLFSKDDFCDAEYLIKLGNKLKGWVLLDDNNEWIGCCFIDNKKHPYNKDGIHFLEVCTFPKYRNKGYGKYLMKIMFDNSLSKLKSVCIAPDNIASQTLFKKYGFTKHGKRKYWDVYLCDKDFYPDELKQLKMVEIEKHHKSFNRKNFR